MARPRKLKPRRKLTLDTPRNTVRLWDRLKRSGEKFYRDLEVVFPLTH